MEKRTVLFLVLSFAILVGYQALLAWLVPPPPRKPPGADAVAEAEKEPGEGQPAHADVAAKGESGEDRKPRTKDDRAEKPLPEERPGPEAKPEEQQEPAESKDAPEAAEPEPPEQWITLGSADPASPYRMLVTLTNRGAAVAMVELSSSRYQDLTDRKGLKYDRSGYLGRVAVDEDLNGVGCPVQVVGPGTPAEAAGLKPGDVLTAVGDRDVLDSATLRKALEHTRPRQTVVLSVLRDGRPLELEATLGERPLAVIRPEQPDPFSFLLTLAQVDDEELETKPPSGDEPGPAHDLEQELRGVTLRHGRWQVAESAEDKVVFRRKVPQWGLELTKTYRLAEVPAEEHDNENYRAYHLVLELAIHNSDETPHSVAYQLDGPTGLPIEAWWYAYKVSHGWSGVGVRDVVKSFGTADPSLVSCRQIAQNDVDALPWQGEPLNFMGVDAQYFSAVVIPQKESAGDVWFARSWPMTVGAVDPDHPNLTNTSFRLVSVAHQLKPDETLAREFVVFAGPKKPPLLAHYGLGKVVYYGWFTPVAKPMLWVLHFIYDHIIGNYGIAIVMLTVLVRLAMFPLSRKQTLNALKMQELQPEIKRIQEKYKKDLEARTRAQQELFRKHNYNPLGGCLVMFIQIPIFVALYRSLMVDVELRQAPLLWESIRWCSNLSAPDMFLDWTGFMPGFITKTTGFTGLGPYLNILPLLTVALFLAQQKMLMPPPADEQAAMQQKVMTYMMLFMGLIFFKVAAGLCIYFIASSLWGLGERQFLPKAKPKDAEDEDAALSPAASQPSPRPGSNGQDRPAGSRKKRKKARGKR